MPSRPMPAKAIVLHQWQTRKFLQTCSAPYLQILFLGTWTHSCYPMISECFQASCPSFVRLSREVLQRHPDHHLFVPMKSYSYEKLRASMVFTAKVPKYFRRQNEFHIISPRVIRICHHNNHSELVQISLVQGIHLQKFKKKTEIKHFFPFFKSIN